MTAIHVNTHTMVMVGSGILTDGNESVKIADSRFVRCSMLARRYSFSKVPPTGYHDPAVTGGPLPTWKDRQLNPKDGQSQAETVVSVTAEHRPRMRPERGICDLVRGQVCPHPRTEELFDQ